jgi:two-component system sensor histidine kinase ChiS
MTHSGSLLIVDDEEPNRYMLGKQLSLTGYSVTTVGNGRQALAALERHQFDLVLLDVMMPELNGLEVLRLIRQRFSPSDLPVVMITVRDESQDVVESFDLGSNDYITKPIEFSLLLERVSTHLLNKRERTVVREIDPSYPALELGEAVR